MTINQILKICTEKLHKCNIKNPPLEAEILLAFLLKKPREFLLAHPEIKLSKKQTSNFQFLISKRLAGWPVAYLIGHKEFYGLDFLVNRNVLIPRPETELMVEEAVNLLSRIAYRVSPNAKGVKPLKRGLTPYYIIDLGTGSGCLIITLAKLFKDRKSDFGYPKSDFSFLATDISKKALTVARKNAKLNKVDDKIKFLQGNLLEPITKNPNFQFQISNFFILANLPYLTPSQIKNSPTIQSEPSRALNGGRDGLKYYRELFGQIKKISDMRYAIQDTRYVLCEIDPSQKNKMIKLIKNNLPKATYQIKKDLRGHHRLIIIRISS